MIEQVVLTVAAVDADLAASELWDQGAVAVEERSTGDRVELIASFGDRAVEPIVGALGARWMVEVRPVLDDGLTAWRAFAQPVWVRDRLVVVPAWLPAPPTAAAIMVIIETGRAFGVGDHPTTRLALDALVEYVRAGARVLDVGCGTGVLAIAAVMLGAASATAIDVDPEAVECTQDNAARNLVADRVRASTTGLAQADRDFDIVVANLGGATTPISLAPELLARVAPGGVLIVTGMLGEQAGDVAAAFARPTSQGRTSQGRTNRNSSERVDLDGWACLVFR